MSKAKLDSGQQNILSLIRKGQDTDGWASVSASIARHAFIAGPYKLPSELYEFEPVGDDGRGRVRLTTTGNSVLDAMVYL